MTYRVTFVVKDSLDHPESFGFDIPEADNASEALFLAGVSLAEQYSYGAEDTRLVRYTVNMWPGDKKETPRPVRDDLQEYEEWAVGASEYDKKKVSEIGWPLFKARYLDAGSTEGAVHNYYNR